jgi:hypothetical protein
MNQQLNQFQPFSNVGEQLAPAEEVSKFLLGLHYPEEITADLYRKLVTAVIEDIKEVNCTRVQGFAIDTTKNSLPEDFITATTLNDGTIKVEVSILDLSHFIGFDDPIVMQAIKLKANTYTEDGYVDTPIFNKTFMNELYSEMQERNTYPTYTVTMYFDSDGYIHKYKSKLARTYSSIKDSATGDEADDFSPSENTPGSIAETSRILVRLAAPYLPKDPKPSTLSSIGYIKRVAMSHLGSALQQAGYPGISQVGAESVFRIPHFHNQLLVDGFTSMTPQELKSVSRCFEAVEYLDIIPNGFKSQVPLPIFTQLSNSFSPFAPSLCRFRADCPVRNSVGFVNSFSVNNKISGIDPTTEEAQKLKRFMNLVAAYFNQPILDLLEKS